ncbi:MAG: HAD-IA family hydrolase [Candidatus Roizmanbacteria bacterium]
MKRLIIFDVDGTLFDISIYIRELIYDISKEHSIIPPTEEEIEELRKLSFKEIIKYFKIPWYRLPFVIVNIRKSLHKLRNNMRPVKGMVDAVHSLHSNGFRMAIVTSNTEENIHDTLALFPDVFDNIVSSVHPFGKDSAIRSLIRSLHIDIDDVIYVGDELRDFEACKKIGLDCICVTWGINSKEAFLRMKAPHIVSNMKEFSKIILSFRS